ncbi:MAG: protein O-mannosyl-transferase family, partial [Anaerolineales bacterium]
MGNPAGVHYGDGENTELYPQRRISNRESPIYSLQSRIPSWSFDAALGLAFLGLYALTTARDVLPADAGEFQAVVPLLGVAHPPGFALYTLLGKLFITLVPLGAPAFRLNLFAAVTGAATLAVVSRAVRALSSP